MAKRFTDTDKWKDDWYLSLNNDYRLIWLWLLDNCNHAGLCKRSITLLNMMCNTKITEEDLLEVFKDRILIYQDYWFITKFIFFQYGNDFITSNSKAVKSALKSMIQFGIVEESVNGDIRFTIPLPNPYLTLTQPLHKSINTIKDKAMDKDKDKDKDKALEKDKSDFDRFQSYFPQGKNSITHNELMLWDTMSSRDKQICLQLTPFYVEFHMKNGKGNFIKNIKKFLNDGFWNDLFQFQSRYLGGKFQLKEIPTEPSKKLNLSIDEIMTNFDEGVKEINRLQNLKR